jgi:hypothetical protein
VEQIHKREGYEAITVLLLSGVSVPILIGSVAGSDREVALIINIQFMAGCVISHSD